MRTVAERGFIAAYQPRYRRFEKRCISPTNREHATRDLNVCPTRIEPSIWASGIKEFQGESIICLICFDLCLRIKCIMDERFKNDKWMLILIPACKFLQGLLLYIRNARTVCVLLQFILTKTFDTSSSFPASSGLDSSGTWEMTSLRDLLNCLQRE